MPIDKRVASATEALADVADGATVFISGFGGAGFPNVLIRALRDRGAKDLTLVVNSATHRYSLFDYLATIGAMVALSIPTFWFGLVGIYVFSLRLGWVPAGNQPSRSEKM